MRSPMLRPMKRVDFGHLVMSRRVRIWVALAVLAVAGLALPACSSDSGTTGAGSGSGSAASAGASSGLASGGSTGSNATGGSGGVAITGSMQGSGSIALSGASAGSTASGTSGSGADSGFMGSGSDGGATSGTDGGSMNEAGLSDAPAGDASGPLLLTSSGFKEGDTIPLAYKCAQGTPQSMGMNMSPPLSWTPGPAQAKSYAVVLVHLASDMSVHWVLWDIAPGTTSLPANIPEVPNPPMPAGTSQMKPGVDGSTWFGYQGVCPRPGAGTQRYEYSVYALDVSKLPNVTTQSTGMAVLAAVKAHQLAHATLSGTEMY